MSPAEFLQQMKTVEDGPGDSETFHKVADGLLCEVLESLGYGEGVEVFREMTKWYA